MNVEIQNPQEIKEMALQALKEYKEDLEEEKEQEKKHRKKTKAKGKKVRPWLTVIVILYPLFTAFSRLVIPTHASKND